MMSLINVDFPAPFGPSKPNTLPEGTVKLTLLRAGLFSYDFERLMN